MNAGDQGSDVICVGLIVADHICAPIRKIPAQGGLITTDRLELSIGGCAANVGTDLAKLGVGVSLVGCVGDDPFGDYVRKQLQANGVDCDDVIISPAAQTSATMVVNVEGEDRRFIHAVGANTELTGTEVTDDLLRTAKVIYVGGFGLNPELSGENVRDLFSRARQHKVLTLLDVVLDDVNACIDMLKVALPETDLFLPNCDEARLLTGKHQPAEQAALFLEQGAKSVVITSGADGVLLANSAAESVELPAYQVEQVDGTGGGDAFVSGFIYGLLKNASHQLCLNYGSAMGASCVQAQGATTGVFNSAELEEYVKQNPLTH